MIYNAPSIYKQGGGGGGYSDGGALVDGDFIKVENNTISSYDNVSRDPVNFYFEVKDGEILNSVVELTTAVNATINVYVVNNGLFIPLGNVGGDTVNAGDDYKINIVGNSFMIEVVTPAQAEPEAVIIENEIYGIKKIGSLYWTTSNLKILLSDSYTLVSDGSDYQETGRVLDYTPKSIITRGNIYYRSTVLGEIDSIVSSSGFRVPTKSEFISAFGSTPAKNLTTLSSGGDNSTGFSANTDGVCSAFCSGYPLQALYNLKPNIYESNAKTWAFWTKTDRYGFMLNWSNLNYPATANHQFSSSNYNSDYLNIRLCANL